MRYWVLLHKPTGSIMPASYTNGSTYWEPTCEKSGLRQNDPPRLFTCERAANCCATWWTKGYAGKSYSNYGYSAMVSLGYSCDVTMTSQPVEGRKREDMIVIEVALELFL